MRGEINNSSSTLPEELSHNERRSVERDVVAPQHTSTLPIFTQYAHKMQALLSKIDIFFLASNQLQVVPHGDCTGQSIMATARIGVAFHPKRWHGGTRALLFIIKRHTFSDTFSLHIA